MSLALEELELELTDEEKAEQEEYDKVFFADENEAPQGEVKDEEPKVDEEAVIPKEEEADPDEIPKAEENDETPGDPDKVPEVDPEADPEKVPEQPDEDSEPKYEIKWNGQDVKVTIDEMKAMAQQGFDYTYKSQNLAQEKRDHKAELDLLTRVKGGDKEALAQLSKQSGIDPLDLLDIDVEDIEHGSNQPAAPFMSPEVAELLTKVKSDEGLYEKMQSIETSLPSAVVNVMAQDAGTFYSIVNEVRSGDAEIVLPQVTARLATLPELDRALVMNNPEQYKNFYMNVKQSMIDEMNSSAPETKPAPKGKKPNPAEVGVKRSGGNQQRVPEVETDAFTSDEKYQAILDRLQNQ